MNWTFSADQVVDNNKKIIKELGKYLNDINVLNDYDLDWKWYGHSYEPLISVFEESDGHALCTSEIQNIIQVVEESLSSWDLKDPKKFDD